MANEGSRFIVDLGEFKLPALVEKQVESEIRAIVLRALAENGFGGDPRVPQARVSSPIWNQFPGQILGLWSEWPQRPPVFEDPVGTGPLTIQDHTTIMRAIMEHPFEVVRALPNRYRSKGAGSPPGREVLQAALQVEQIDDYTKQRIRAVLDLMPKIEEAQAALPDAKKRELDTLRQRLANKNLEEKRSVFREAAVRNRHREDGLAEAMDLAAQVLEDGRDSIYSPEHTFYKLLQPGQGSARATARFGLSGIADADGIGAAAGGLAGSFAVGVGAGPGAVVGGAGASAGALISDAIDWIGGLFD